MDIATQGLEWKEVDAMEWNKECDFTLIIFVSLSTITLVS